MANNIAILKTARSSASLAEALGPSLAALVKPHSEDWWGPSAFPTARKPEVRAALERVEQTFAGAGDDVRPLLGRMALVLKSANASDAELAAKAEIYVEFLGCYPVDAVANACDEAIRTCEWFPTIAELRKLCEKAMGRRREVRWRLRRLLELPEPEPQLTPEELAERARRMDEIKARCGEALSAMTRAAGAPASDD